jgi:uncharacterized membrane protein YgdD (TMEM256/DUF423 family)
MERLFFALGAASGLIGVAAGAFGAHALKGRVAEDLQVIFETAARYQLIHALALLGAGYAAGRWPGGAAAAAGWLFAAGTLVFSGSLYVLALTGARWLGAVTPLGGAALIAGWACLVFTALRGGRAV